MNTIVPPYRRLAASTGRVRSSRSPRERLGIALGVAIPYLAGRIIGPWADAIVPLAFGIALFASLIAGRPLIATIASRRAATRPNPAIDLSSPTARRALARLTAIWGVAMVAQAGVVAALVAAHAQHLSTINTVTSVGVPAVLVLATIAWVRHRRTPATRTV